MKFLFLWLNEEILWSSSELSLCMSVLRCILFCDTYNELMATLCAAPMTFTIALFLLRSRNSHPYYRIVSWSTLHCSSITEIELATSLEFIVRYVQSCAVYIRKFGFLPISALIRLSDIWVSGMYPFPVIFSRTTRRFVTVLPSRFGDQIRISN